MTCVGRLNNLHRKLPQAPGTGVVISGEVYRIETGKILTSPGTVNRLGLKGRMPMPLVVAHSGNTAMTRFGLEATSSDSVVSLAPDGGSVWSCEELRACQMARQRPMRNTLRLFGKLMVKMGSNMAARYTASMGLVKLETIMLVGGALGMRSGGCWDKEPRLTPSSCRSPQMIQGMVRMPQVRSF